LGGDGGVGGVGRLSPPGAVVVLGVVVVVVLVLVLVLVDVDVDADVEVDVDVDVDDDDELLEEVGADVDDEPPGTVQPLLVSWVRRNWRTKTSVDWL
jgi:hypothetical protein